MSDSSKDGADAPKKFLIWMWTKRVWLCGAIGVMLIDVVHYELNRIYAPFTGPVDYVFHAGMHLHVLFYVPVGIGLFVTAMESLYQHVRWLRHWGMIAGLLVVPVVVSEMAFALHAEPRGRSSNYYPLFPDYFAGLVIATLCVLSVWSLGNEKRSWRIAGYVIAFWWMLIPFNVDLIYATEGTARGTGPLWDVPAIGLVASAVMLPILGMTLPVAPVISGDRPNVVPWLGVVSLVLGIVLARWLDTDFWRNRSSLPQKVALIAAAAAFVSCMPMWASFIAD